MVHARVHNRFKIILAFVQEKIFTDAVENYDRIVDGKTHNDEKRNNKVAVYFHMFVMPEEGDEPRGNHDVVKKSE